MLGKQKSVLIVHPRLEVLGGAEEVFLTFVESLKEMNIDISVLTMFKPRITLPPEVKVHYILPHNPRLIPSHFRVVFPLLMTLRGYFTQADLIISTGGIDLPLFGTAFPYVNKECAPLISYIHGLSSYEEPSIEEY